MGDGEAALGAPVSGANIAWEAAFEAVFRSTQLGLGVLDRELRYLRVNERLAEMQGHPVAAYLGRTVPEVLPTLASRLVPMVERVLATGDGVVDQLMSIGARTLSVSYLPIREGADITGAAIILAETGASASAHELLDRLRFEEAISSASALLFDVAPDRFEGTVTAALEQLARTVEADGATLYELRTHMDGTLRLDRTHGFARAGRALGPALSIEARPGSWIEEALSTDRPFSSGGELPAGGASALLDEVGGRSLLAVPLRAGAGPLGLLAFHTVEERDWPETILTRLGLLGEVFSSALARQRADLDARERLDFEVLLASIARALVDVRVDDTDAQIERVLGMVCTATGFVRATLVRFGEGDAFSVTHAWGTQEALVRRGEVARLTDLGVERDDLVVRGRRVWRTEDLPPHAAALRSLWERMGYVAMVAIPLELEGSVVGALTLFSARPRYDVEIIVTRSDVIADLLSAALARGRAELERRAAFEEVSRLKVELERQRDYLREEIGEGHDVRCLIAESPAIRRVLDTIEAVAVTSATVLVRGESGVGKELVARAIHQKSARATRPMVKVSCASIPHELFESEFFGHVRGSIPSALRDRAGRFELADAGTIFLDEIGEIPLALQAKLLRVLQEGELERIGDDHTRKVDVRIIATTNRDLEREVDAGAFRRDLYYRLSAFPVDVPPLRARIADVVPLARHFLERAQHALGRGGLTLTEEDERALIACPWPGNVRELMHVIERAVILSREPPLRLDLALPSVEQPSEERPLRVRTFQELRELEQENMRAALEQADGQIAGRGGAAELLGISPSTLRDRMRAFGLSSRTRR